MMIRPADLPDTIPLFPLPGALLLPRGRLPLHVFEPRYLAMVEDCLKTPHRLIGMVQPRDLPPGRAFEAGGFDAGGSRAGESGAGGSGAGGDRRPDLGDARLHLIGCAGRLTGFSETEDRRYLISLTGVSRFRLRAEVDGFTPYRRAGVDWGAFRSDMAGAEDDPGLDRDGFLDLLSRYFASENLDAEWQSLRDAEPELLINSLSMLCPFSTEDKQALLEAPTLATRRETLTTLMEFALRGGKGDEVLQ